MKDKPIRTDWDSESVWGDDAGYSAGLGVIDAPFLWHDTADPPPEVSVIRRRSAQLLQPAAYTLKAVKMTADLLCRWVGYVSQRSGIVDWADQAWFEVIHGGPTQRWAMLVFVAVWLSYSVKILRLPAERLEATGSLAKGLRWLGGRVGAGPMGTPMGLLSAGVVAPVLQRGSF